MSKGRRRVPRYLREASARDREATDASKVAEEAAAREDARSRARWVRQGKAVCAAAERERQAAWSAVDPARRLRRVRPFDISPHHGITKEGARRFEEIKLATLGYLECTIVTRDEGRCHLSEGHLGSVASREDAERLLTALATEFPHVSFRIELEEELLENVVWRTVDDVLQDAADAAQGTSLEG